MATVAPTPPCSSTPGDPTGQPICVIAVANTGTSITSVTTIQPGGQPSTGSGGGGIAAAFNNWAATQVRKIADETLRTAVEVQLVLWAKEALPKLAQAAQQFGAKAVDNSIIYNDDGPPVIPGNPGTPPVSGGGEPVEPESVSAGSTPGVKATTGTLQSTIASLIASYPGEGASLNNKTVHVDPAKAALEFMLPPVAAALGQQVTGNFVNLSA